MYRLRYLPAAEDDLVEAESYLDELSHAAADKLSTVFEQKMDTLAGNPFMYTVYEAKPYFRCLPLPYEYLCFYHVDEDAKMINVHRVLRGMRDISNLF